MWYLLTILTVLIVAVGVLRLRLRLDISDERKYLFIGLGRTGSEFDLSQKLGTMKLFGHPIRQFRLDKGTARKKDEPVDDSEKEKKKSVSRRRRPVKSISAVAPQSLEALGKYLAGLWRATIVEQLEGEIRAGFDSPAATGQAFGYYQAVLGVAPGLGERVRYYPDWTGPSFSGQMKCQVAWPLYQLVWQTGLLVGRLPVTKIVKMAIGTK